MWRSVPKFKQVVRLWRGMMIRVQGPSPHTKSKLAVSASFVADIEPLGSADLATVRLLIRSGSFIE
jgi:hypothetical protein